MPMYHDGNEIKTAYANSGEKQCHGYVNGQRVYSCVDATATAIYVHDIAGSGLQLLLKWPHVNGFNYDCNINWGDGTSVNILPGDAWNSPKLTHDYGATTGAGIYEVSVTGLSERLHFWTSGWETLIDVKAWGKNGLTNCYQMFYFCDRCVFTAGPASDTSLVTTMEEMFHEAAIGTPDCSGFNMSNVTTVLKMFRYAGQANPDMSSWDTSSLINMNAFMQFAVSMLGTGMPNWDTSNVEQMGFFASNATVFNQDISNWDATSLLDMWGAIVNTSFTIANYDALLISWAGQAVNSSVPFEVEQRYTAQAAHDVLDDPPNNWQFADLGPV